jgi:sRNA-binding regulator protein Hfq
MKEQTPRGFYDTSGRAQTSAGGIIMRKILLAVLLAAMVGVAQADTIYLKNGSVIKGKVTNFAEDQFTVLLDAGGGRYMSRATIYTGDVSRIEFDSAPGSEAAPRESARDAQPTSTQTDPPRTSAPETPAGQPRDTESTRPEKTNTEKSRSTKAKSEKTKSEKSEPERSEPEKTTPPPAPAESEQPRKTETPTRTLEVEVAAKQDWTSTRILLNRGDRVVINATGTVNLDAAGTRTSGPEGTELADQRKLMADQPTGALIAVIGADNDDFIFVGRSVEFTATRSGLLFLSVNEGLLSDNNGSFKAVIEVYSSQKNK